MPAPHTRGGRTTKIRKAIQRQRNTDVAIWVADASRAIAQSGMLVVVIWTVGAAATADDAQMASRIAATLVLSRWHPFYLIVWFIRIFWLRRPRADPQAVRISQCARSAIRPTAARGNARTYSSPWGADRPLQDQRSTELADTIPTLATICKKLADNILCVDYYIR